MNIWTSPTQRWEEEICTLLHSHSIGDVSGSISKNSTEEKEKQNVLVGKRIELDRLYTLQHECRLHLNSVSAFFST